MEMLPHSFPLFPSGARRARELLLAPLTQWHESQRLYAQCRHLTGLAFVEQLLRELRITVRYEAAELRQLPTGAFVALASHPCSMLDTLVLLHVLGQACPRLRAVVSEQLASLLPQLQQHLVPASAKQLAAGRSVPGRKQLLRCLHNDVPLLLFPAGEAGYRTHLFRPTHNSPWNPATGRLLAAARVPVVPIWLSGQNSGSYSMLGLLPAVLRTAHLPAELLNKRGQTIQVRIGQPVAPAELNLLPTTGQLAYLRARADALGAASGRHPAALPPLLPVPAVLTETCAALIKADIAALRPARCLVRNGRWEVYVAKTVEIPHVLREIGRLRELTLRREGNGTLQSSDLDRYDDVQRHLFLYDQHNQLLVGACRLGLGRAILRQHGRHGFHLHALFHLKKELIPVLRQSLELGRSFVRAEYQKQPLPLALLWKGIAEYLATHPEYRYLLAPVSISGRQVAVSKGETVEYLRRHFFDAELAPHVRPRKPFRFRPLDVPADAPLLPASPGASPGSPQQLQQFIAALKPGGSGVPVLLRQCLRQKARLLGFNMNPRFGNTLDGLLLMDAQELPARAHQLLERYLPPAPPEHAAPARER